jgi:hypothetical protein
MTIKKAATKDQDKVPVEMLLTRYTFTVNGDPLSLAQARASFNSRVHPTARPGWFWTPATPRSAANIRTRGLKAVGTEFTTWIPPQTPVVAWPVQDPGCEGVPRGHHG